jgi:hypothetical protein
LQRPDGGNRLAARIRPCERADLAGVASLYERVVRTGHDPAPPHLAEYFERTFFDCPWQDAATPSLVYEEAGGRIVGFLGTHVRRLRLDGRPIRVACGGQLVVDPAARRHGAGPFLFRAFMAGPQDATITDGANDIVRRMWEIAGGEVAHLKALRWTRVLQPLRFAGGHVLERVGGQAAAPLLRPVWRVMDRCVTALGVRPFRPARPAGRAEPLTTEAVLEHAPVMTASLRAYPDYDRPFLEWLFRELPEVKSRGTLVRALVRDPLGEVLGWYVYYLHRDASEVMQLAARRGAAGDVLDHLLHHAYAHGSAAVRGRVEPHLLDAVASRRCGFAFDGSALIHAKSPAVLGALLSGQCLLGRLDGEWWMGHHTEPFT